MRRPNPLPQAPVAPREEPLPEDVEPDRGGPADAAEESTPIAVLEHARATRPDHLGESPETGAGSASTDGVERDIRLRDVWKAARASRRALRAEVRRFTGRQRRRRLTWMLSLGALVLLVVGSVAAAYSPLFGVERVRVVGAAQLDAAAVEAALSGQLGTPLPLVDESAVKAALVEFPLVETYTLEARPPHELVVRIVERTPIGLIETAAGYTLVDAAGVALSTTQAPQEGQPIVTVEGGTRSAAFTSLGQVMRALPDDIRAQVTAASATTPDDVTLTLGGTNTQVVWGSAESSAMKALALQKMMVQRPPAGVSVYDVSSPTAIVVR